MREYGDLSAEARDALSACGVGALASRDVTLSYANWTAEEVLRAVLGRPDASGFSVVGHILHLNLREHLEPYKALIGRVYLDKVTVMHVWVEICFRRKSKCRGDPRGKRDGTPRKLLQNL